MYVVVRVNLLETDTAAPRTGALVVWSLEDDAPEPLGVGTAKLPETCEDSPVPMGELWVSPVAAAVAVAF